MNREEENKSDVVPLKENEDHHHKSTSLQAYFNFLKSLIGIGIIALPFATNTVGWLYSFILVIPIAYFSLRSNTFLAEVADDLQVDGLLYADLMRVTFGMFWGQMIDIVLVTSQVSICIAYLIFLTQSVQISFENIGIEMSKWIPFASTLIVIIPLSFIKKMHFFHKSSKYGFYCALIALFLVMVDSFQLIGAGNYDFSNKFNIKNTFKYIGVAILACEGAPTLLPVRDSMQDRFDFQFVGMISIVSAFVLSALTSFVSIVAYSDSTKPIIIFNITNSYSQFAAILTYSISLLMTYSLQLFPAVQIIEEYLNKEPYSAVTSEETNSQKSSPNKEVFATDQRGVIIRVITMIIIYLIAYWVPNFSHFLNLIGSVLGTAIQLLFPTLIHIYHFRKTSRQQPKTLYVMLFIMCGLTMILGTTQSVHSMVTE